MVGGALLEISPYDNLIIGLVEILYVLDLQTNRNTDKITVKTLRIVIGLDNWARNSSAIGLC
jgi:hypothetical protein